MPVSSLFSPLLSLMVFIIGTLYELRQVSDCISIKEWGNQLKNQYDGGEKLDFGFVEYTPTTYYNPSTGYPMHGGFDSAGNTFGTCCRMMTVALQTVACNKGNLMKTKKLMMVALVSSTGPFRVWCDEHSNQEA